MFRVARDQDFIYSDYGNDIKTFNGVEDLESFMPYWPEELDFFGEPSLKITSEVKNGTRIYNLELNFSSTTEIDLSRDYFFIVTGNDGYFYIVGDNFLPYAEISTEGGVLPPKESQQGFQYKVKHTVVNGCIRVKRP